MNRSLRRPLNTIRGRGRTPGSTSPRPATTGIPPLKSTPRNMFNQNIADTPAAPSITPTPIIPLTNDLAINKNNNNNNKRNINRHRKIETKQNSKIIPPPPPRTSFYDNYNGIRPPYS